nr:MAG TPA: restriction alleviation protein [Caudoviricetes sp.]
MAEYEPKSCPFCGDKGVVQRSGYCFRVCCSNRDCPIEPRTH